MFIYIHIMYIYIYIYIFTWSFFAFAQAFGQDPIPILSAIRDNTVGAQTKHRPDDIPRDIASVAVVFSGTIET